MPGRACLGALRMCLHSPDSLSGLADMAEGTGKPNLPLSSSRKFLEVALKRLVQAVLS